MRARPLGSDRRRWRRSSPLRCPAPRSTSTYGLRAAAAARPAQPGVRRGDGRHLPAAAGPDRSRPRPGAARAGLAPGAGEGAGSPPAASRWVVPEPPSGRDGRASSSSAAGLAGIAAALDAGRRRGRGHARRAPGAPRRAHVVVPTATGSRSTTASTCSCAAAPRTARSSSASAAPSMVDAPATPRRARCCRPGRRPGRASPGPACRRRCTSAGARRATATSAPAERRAAVPRRTADCGRVDPDDGGERPRHVRLLAGRARPGRAGDRGAVGPHRPPDAEPAVAADALAGARREGVPHRPARPRRRRRPRLVRRAARRRCTATRRGCARRARRRGRDAAPRQSRSPAAADGFVVRTAAGRAHGTPTRSSWRSPTRSRHRAARRPARLPGWACDPDRGSARSPIVNVHLVYDRRVTDLPSPPPSTRRCSSCSTARAPPGCEGGGQYLAISLSAADERAGDLGRASSSRTMIEAALGELLPAASRARVVDGRVTRERAATFRGVPGSAAHRAAGGVRHPGPRPSPERGRTPAGPTRWRGRCAAATPRRRRPRAPTVRPDRRGTRPDGPRAPRRILDALGPVDPAGAARRRRPPVATPAPRPSSTTSGGLDLDGRSGRAATAASTCAPRWPCCRRPPSAPTSRSACPAPSPIELVHNFSLIHDDLMDDDRERRHRPTVWAAFGPATAIIAGDALPTLAVQVLLEQPGPAVAAAPRALHGGDGADDRRAGRRPRLRDARRRLARRVRGDGAPARPARCWVVRRDARRHPRRRRRAAGRRARRLRRSTSGWRSRPSTTSSASGASPRSPASRCGSDLRQGQEDDPRSSPRSNEPTAAGPSCASLLDASRDVDDGAAARAAELIERCGGRAVTERHRPARRSPPRSQALERRRRRAGGRRRAGADRPLRRRAGPMSVPADDRRERRRSTGASTRCSAMQHADGLVEGRARHQRHDGRRGPAAAPVPRRARPRAGAAARRRGSARSSATTAPGRRSTAAPATCRPRSRPTSRCASPATPPTPRTSRRPRRSSASSGGDRGDARVHPASGWRCSGCGRGTTCRRCRPRWCCCRAWVPLNIYDFACWARQTIVPLTVVAAHRPVRPLPFGIDELRIGSSPGRRRAPASCAGRAAAAASTGCCTATSGARSAAAAGAGPGRAERVDRRPPGGRRLVGRHPAAVGVLDDGAAPAAATPLDHPVMARGVRRARRASRVHEDGTRRLEACQSPVWDTALAVVGAAPTAAWRPTTRRWSRRRRLAARRGDPRSRRLVGAPAAARARRLGVRVRQRQLPRHRRHGRGRAGPARGVATGDDRRRATRPSTAGVDVDARHAVPRRRLGGVRRRQHPRDRAATLPFCDFGEVIDPPSADVTAHVVEMLAAARRRDAAPPRCGRGIEWLWRAQEADGSWFGRWGANHVYGTGARRARARRRRRGPRRPAAASRRSSGSPATRSADGGWGEDLRSYRDAGVDRPRRIDAVADGVGAARPARRSATAAPPSTAASPSSSRTQRPDGTWDEPVVHRHRVPGRLLHQLPPVPAGVPADGAGARPEGRSHGRPDRSSRRCGSRAAPCGVGSAAPATSCSGMGTRAAPRAPARAIADSGRRRWPWPGSAAGCAPASARARCVVASEVSASDGDAASVALPVGRRRSPTSSPARRLRRDRRAGRVDAAAGRGATRRRQLGRRRRRGRRHGVGVARRAARSPSTRTAWPSCGCWPTPPGHELVRPRRCAAGSGRVPHAARDRPGARDVGRRGRPRARRCSPSPRSFCAGVERAITVVRPGPRALRRARLRAPPDHPQHPRRRRARRRPARCSSPSSTRCPRGAVAVLAAHGVAPAVRDEAAAPRPACVIDATCPLVAKVHAEARAPPRRRLLASCSSATTTTRRSSAPGARRPSTIQRDRERPTRSTRLDVADPERVAYLTQTTLALDETAAVVAALDERFPTIVGPRADDICYATQNRQEAVRGRRRRIRPGARRRLGQLVELQPPGRGGPPRGRRRPPRRGRDARSTCRGSPALAPSAITAGASAPEHLVQRRRRPPRLPRCRSPSSSARVADEDVQFSLPAGGPLMPIPLRQNLRVGHVPDAPEARRAARSTR